MVLSLETKLVIDLKKLSQNVDAIQAKLKPGVKQMAVIKDNAYGHGAVQVAHHIKNKVEWFIVVRLYEAIELREAGIENPILVLEIPKPSEAPVYKKMNITAMIADVDTFDILEVGTDYQLNFDTGMSRLGLYPSQADDVLKLMKKYSKLTCSGIFTHFSKADEPHSDKVEEQLATFLEIRKKFPKEIMFHIANSGGIFFYPESHHYFDAVRPGVCLFGYSAGEVEIPELSPILNFETFVMQSKPIKKGMPVSYRGNWVAPEDGWIGVLPIGYGVGVKRELSSKIKVKIDDEYFLQVGNITMDYIMIFSNTRAFKKGEKVIVLDTDKLNAKVWADKAGTIAYEITTSFPRELKREFYR